MEEANQEIVFSFHWESLTPPNHAGLDFEEAEFFSDRGNGKIGDEEDLVKAGPCQKADVPVVTSSINIEVHFRIDALTLPQVGILVEVEDISYVKHTVPIKVSILRGRAVTRDGRALLLREVKDVESERNIREEGWCRRIAEYCDISS